MKIESIDGVNAKATAGGSTIDVNVTLLEEPRVGDYVLVHAGFAIQRIDEHEAEETIKVFNSLIDKNGGAL